MERRRRGHPHAHVAAVPDPTDSKLRLLGVGILCTKVALVPVVFDYGADVPFTVAKGLLSHALAYALVGVLIGLTVAFGRSFLVWSWLHVPVTAFLIANLVATLFAPDTVLALYGTRGRMLGLGTIADWVVLYFAIGLLVRTRGEAVAVIAAALAGSAAVLTYELVQLVGKDPFDWNIDSSSRPFSTLGQTTTLAEYLTVIALGAASFGLFDRTLSWLLRGALLGYSALLLAGAVVTQTRSGAFGVLAGAAGLIVLTWIAHPSRRARIISVVGAGLILAATATADPYNPGERALGGGLVGAGTGAVIGAIAGGGRGAGIGAAVGGGLGAVAGAATTPARPPRAAYRRHYRHVRHYY